ncbi:AzlD domain-containing protein [Zhihengliuella flava]|uniref:Branched-subunit amino acid transport protein AzlD n=1 Tax=Zhihengliuella flava TaxID=1285193 RepID=A0A931GEF1_9MICC|nr:branched-subunit amino acid transport protein AzlD [Zhihengliuella flava]
MADHGYFIAVLATVFVITFALRAVPFAMLKPLRRSRLVQALGLWLPAGILAILAASTLLEAAAGEAEDHLWWQAACAAAVTAVVHLASGRRTLLSVSAGTVVFVVLANTT